MGSRLGTGEKFFGKDRDSVGFKEPRSGGSNGKVLPRCRLKENKLTNRLVPEIFPVVDWPRPRCPFKGVPVALSLSGLRLSSADGKRGICCKLLRGDETWDVERDPEDIGDCGTKRRLSINDLRCSS